MELAGGDTIDDADALRAGWTATALAFAAVTTLGTLRSCATLEAAFTRP